MFPYQVERIWNNFVFSGIAELPETVTDENDMLEKIKNTPGAIGYALSAPDDADLSVVNVVEGG